MSLLKGAFGPLGGADPDMVGSEGCGGLCADLKTEKMIAEHYLARHFSGTQQASVEGELGNVRWAPGTENPADGQPKCGVAWRPRTDVRNRATLTMVRYHH